MQKVTDLTHGQGKAAVQLVFSEVYYYQKYAMLYTDICHAVLQFYCFPAVQNQQPP